MSCIFLLAMSICSGTVPVARLMYRYTHDSDDNAVSPNTPDVKNAAMARHIANAAGTITGLKRRNTGVDTARPKSVAARVRPERPRRVPPTGTRVTTAMIFEAEGPPPLP
uniref:Uncharacterized protein n=1 Tax=Cucumis sativus TaxID=3659 RepID=A0A0A0KR35_CUCSA